MQRPAGEVLVVFCDAGPTHGIGHVMRCLALAEEAASRGARVVFAADLASVPFADAQVRSRGFGVVAPAGDADGHRRVLAATGATAAVIDSYLLAPEVYDAVSATVPTLALVDGDPAGRDAQVQLDQNLGAEHDTWSVPASTTRLAGAAYALVRDDVRSERPAAPRAETGGVPRVLAFFGGTDAAGAGPVLARALVATGLAFDLRVVAPRPWSEEVVAGPGQRVQVIAPTDRLAAEVTAADLVVSAAGSSSWELLCLGAAVAFVRVAENQATGYARLVADGCGLGLGGVDEVRADPGPAAEVLVHALTDTDLRARLRRRAWETVDGEGRARVLDALLAAEGSRVVRAHR